MSPEELEAAERRRSRRSAALLGAIFTAGFMAWSLWWMPVVHGAHFWLTPDDIWMTTRVSEYIRYGAYPYLYQAASGYYALPLGAILMVPAVVVADALGLVSGYPFVLDHPSMWLVVGPASAALSAVSLDAVRRLAWAYGARRRLLAVQCVAVLTVVLPCSFYGHPEDALAVAAACYCLAAVAEGRWERSGWWLAVAICSKQWAVLAAPALLVACPPGKRRSFAAATCLLPLALVAPCALLDPGPTLHSLLLPTTDLALPFGHLGIAAMLGPDAARWSRPAAVALAAIGGVLICRRHPQAVPVVVMAAFVLRAVSEPLVFGYYFAPGLTVLAAIAVARGRHGAAFGGLAVVALGALWVQPAQADDGLWWLGLGLVGLLAALVVLRRHGGTRGAAEPSFRAEGFSFRQPLMAGTVTVDRLLAGAQAPTAGARGTPSVAGTRSARPAQSAGPADATSAGDNPTQRKESCSTNSSSTSAVGTTRVASP